MEGYQEESDLGILFSEISSQLDYISLKIPGNHTSVEMYEKTARSGVSKGNTNSRRQALIRIMFNVLNRGDKNDKNFIRK